MRNGVNSLARHGLAYPVSYDVATRDLSTMLMLSKKRASPFERSPRQLNLSRTIVTKLGEQDYQTATASPNSGTPPDMINLIAAARQLFTESEDQEFQQKYQAALQQEPEVVMAHSALMKLLRLKT